MKKNLEFIAILLVFAASACQKDVQQPSAEISLSASTPTARASAPGNAVYLSVAVEDDITNVNKIRSDNGAIYINGQDRVEAQFLSDGHFYMNTNNNTVKVAIRNLKVLSNTDINLSGVRSYSLRTAPLVDGSTKPITSLSIGESQYMSFRVWGVKEGGVLSWKLLFRNGDTREDPLTDYVKVTRQANNVNGIPVWTMEPAYLSAAASNAKLEDINNSPMGSGYYQVPFKLTLTKTGR